MKSIQLFVVVAIVVCMGYSCEAQTRLLDSLRAELHHAKDTIRLALLEELAWNSADYDPLLSKRFAEEELALAETLSHAGYKALAMNNLAYYYYVVNMLDSAIFLQKKVMEISRSLKSEERVASSLNNLGTYYWRIDDIDNAMDYYIQALKSYEKIGAKSGTARVMNNVAGIFSKEKKYREALQNFAKALHINIEIKDSFEICTNLMNIGSTYENLKSYDSALTNFTRALLIADKIGERINKAILQMSIGNITRKTGDYRQALDWYKKSDELNAALGSTDRRVENLIYMGMTYVLLHEYEQAEKILLSALEQAERLNLKTYARRAYAALADLHEKLSDYKQANHYHKLYSQMSDSLFNEESSKKIMELNIKYETEKKEHQIAFHQKEIEVLNQTARADRLRKSLLGGGLLAATLIGGLAFYSIRQKLKREESERTKERESYEKDLAFKKKELAIHTLHLVQKSELLESIHEKLEELRKEPDANKNAIRRLVQLIKNDYQTEKDWQNFKSYFEQVHEHFDTKLREHFNDLTHHEIRLATLLKMNLSTKEIAAILNISPDSVNKARYRLRKKLNLSTEDSLENFLLAL